MNRCFSFILAISAICISQAQSNDRALAVADSLFASGNYSKAITVYEALPKSASGIYKLAKSYEALGDRNTALAKYDTLLMQFPEATKGQLDYAKLLMATKRFSKADSLLTTLYKTTDDNPNLPYLLGESKEKQNDSTAITYYKLAKEIDPNHLNALYKVTRYHVVKRHFEIAMPLIDEGLQKEGESTRFLNLKALSHFYDKDYHNAIATYNQLLELGERTQQAYENLAESYMKTFQYFEAIEPYKMLINSYDDKNWSWHYQLGRAYFFERDLEKAQNQFRVALLILDKPLDEQYLNFAMTFVAQENYKKGIEFLNVALSENPENQMAQYQLAVAADNYYEDKKAVLRLYERYLEKFGSKGYFSQLSRERISDIKEALHFENTKTDN